MTESLVLPRERVYFVICLVSSLLIYLAALVSLVGIIYFVIGAIISFILQGLFIGYIRGNGVRVSESQFPEVYRVAQSVSNNMGLESLPSIYVLQAGGLLNAFATRFFFRNFVVIYSDVLELAYDEGESALAFVLCHELAHIKRGHVTWRWLILPALLIPFLGTAYLRAGESTCDRFGARYQPDGAIEGLLVLAAGKKLYRVVNPQAFRDQAQSDRGFWTWFSEVLSTHPHLPKRVAALQPLLTSPESRVLA